MFKSQDMNNSKLFSDEAANIYERAIGTLLKKNMLLYFSFADYEEVSFLSDIYFLLGLYWILADDLCVFFSPRSRHRVA